MKKILLFVPSLLLAVIGTMNAQTVIFSEDFQGTTGTGVPTGWTKSQAASNTTSGWQSGTALASTYFAIPAHTRYMAVNDDATQASSTSAAVDNGNDLLYSPSINLSTASFPVVKFDLFYFAATTPVETATVEVSTDNGATWTAVETLAGAGGWNTHATSLTSYAGNANVMVGIRYNDGADWAYGIAIDNFSVIEPLAKEVAANKVIMNKYVLAGSQPVSTVIQSFGGPVLSTVELNYSVDGGVPVTQSFSPAISFNGTYTANFTSNAALAAGWHQVKSWVSNINGTGVDANNANDTCSWGITVLTTAPTKNVLIEEFTGAWCGYCPRGGVTLSALTSADPQILGAAIHGGGTDAMATTEGTTVINSYAQGFPTGMVDRSFVSTVSAPDYAIDDASWGATATARKADVVPATVALSNVSFNATTRVVTATVTATFVGAVKAPFSLNCYLTENYVYGPLAATSDNGWNQHSYYYASSGSPFQGIGMITSPWSTSVAGLMPTMYQHHHVVDKMIGGAYGDATVIPTTLVVAGTTFSKIFTYTLPAANPGGAHRFNADNIYVIGLVEEYSATDNANRYILNATEQKLNSNPEATGVEELTATSFGSFGVYPNPASTSANIALTLFTNENVVINVYNTLGQVVYTENSGTLTSGDHIININTEGFASGIYNVSVSTSKGVVSKKVTISK